MSPKMTSSALLAGALLWGCGQSQSQSQGPGARNPLAAGEEQGAGESVLYAGDAVGPPSIEGLPEADVPHAELSDEMKRAWLLSEESLAVPPPAPPVDRSADLQEYSDTVLRSWMETKTQRAMAAREELNAAADNSPRERIMAGAVLGVVYEDVARELAFLPVPGELQSEPEIAAMYREVMHSHAEPFLANARSAYKACTGNAKNTKLLSNWGRYCEHRRQVLPGGKIEAVDGTVVTVERE